MNRRRWQGDGQHGWSILWVIGKSLGQGNLRGGVVSWHGQNG